ncbi:tetratricopeptide repeat protein [Sandaracinus amylolyticus]|uniref:Tetratricopeptide repeat protein n=1 Tax=Sandaracinus amylolyticus TaxID=927083 RepID=A0A0F6YJW4_9BACT|nr:tetratricopeptide repeat protein [Sandaracinus amylolyticus]AKF07510.1 hypothetical protein DB32_004659 [Sandaracinus amylolyticus]
MRTLAAILGALIIALAAPVDAQGGGDMEQARALFQAGLAAAREARWDEAREAFERSLAIAERPNTLLNLAGAQAQTGRLVAAVASYRRFLELATSGREARYRSQAGDALAALEPRIARLTIATAGLEDDDEVQLDGTTVTSLAASIPVDPGAHVARIVRDGEEVARQSIALGEGEVRTVALEAPRVVARAEPVAVAAPFVVEREDERDQGDGDTWLWVGIGVGAAVVVGVAIGVAVAVTSSESGPLYSGNLGDGMARF